MQPKPITSEPTPSEPIQPKLSREDEAKLALEHTVVTRPVAWLLTAAFLLTIFLVPLAQNAIELRNNLELKREGEPVNVLPRSFDIFALLPTVKEIRRTRNLSDFENLLPTPQELKDYETMLEDESLAADWVLPRAQLLLTADLGLGNEQAYIGRERWLMYRPDVDYLISPGFLDPALLRIRKRSGDESSAMIQPDPVSAIVDFKNQLAQRGVELIVMPVPVKAMVQPEKLSGRYTPAPANLQNPSYNDFLKALHRHSIHVFDPTTTLRREKRTTATAQYLQTDTHWTPAAMQAVAAGLAKTIRRQIHLPQAPPTKYVRTSQRVENLGDIALMLKLPPHQKLFPTQQVTIQPVRDPGGKLWQPREDASILLLGDSFSNMYSSKSSFDSTYSKDGMGWGEGAGLAEQVSYELQRPLDVIIHNAGGSYVTRRHLQQELRRNPHRLDNTKLVIWEFSMRDLLIGDWQLIPLSSKKSTTR